MDGFARATVSTRLLLESRLVETDIKVKLQTVFIEINREVTCSIASLQKLKAPMQRAVAPVYY